MTRAACTIIAGNYLPYARALATSFANQSHDAEFHVLLIAGHEHLGADEPFHAMTPADIGLGGRRFRLMATVYDVMELATAVKPWLLESLLDDGYDSVLYLDPDIFVYRSLDDVFAATEAGGLTVTPHSLVPIPRDGRLPEDRDFLISGAQNLGYVGVAPAARAFLHWWQERLERDCLNAPEDGLFVDQRWVDLGLTHHRHQVLDDPGLNVAYWNLHGRPLSESGGRVHAGGSPLTFFHFSGFRPELPDQLSIHERGLGRTSPSADPLLERLCSEYATTLNRAGYPMIAARYPYDVAASGLALTRPIRRAYRLDLLEAERAGRLLPDAFEPEDAGAFADWAATAVPAPRPALRYRFEVRARRADARLPQPARTALRRAYSAVRARVPQGPRSIHTQPETTDPVHDALSLAPGANIVGYMSAESGVGGIARSLVDAARASEIPHSVMSSNRTIARQSDTGAQPSESQPGEFPVNILCINADAIDQLLDDIGEPFLKERYNIGFWAWEVDTFPWEMAAKAQWLDEIWVYSRHAADAIAPRVRVPVLRAPVVVRRPPAPSTRRPGPFRFLFMFDHLSVFERKNPLDVVRAYLQAFPEGSNTSLTIKSVNGHTNVVGQHLLERAAAARRDIVITDGYLRSSDVAALMADADCYVSLHRAEGFGLTIAEAMSMGKPTIATGYSGNLEFMRPWNSVLIPYTAERIGPGHPPYPEEGSWAQPDVDAAARAMRSIFDDPQMAMQLGAAAVRQIEEHHSPAALGQFMLERIAMALTAA